MVSEPTLLRLGGVQQLLGDPRNPRAFRLWVNRQEAAGAFPARVRLSNRVHVWRRAELEAWLASRPRGRQ
jgi:predicted DNA-binding transcriptional regulator AlpA